MPSDDILKNCDVVFHLANIANDPAVDLNPELSWEVNVLATMKILESCIKHNVKQFIYASSGSVYGIKDEDQVTEDLELKPISEYNKTKMVDLPEGSTANDLVNRLDLHPDGVLVVTDEEKMKPIPLVIALPEKPIRIILVASGG